MVSPQQKVERQRRRLEEFDASLPSSYRHFDSQKYPRPDIAEKLFKEWHGDSLDDSVFDERPGLIFYGSPRSGKTRLAIELVRRHIKQEGSLTDARFLSAVQWASEASSRARNSELDGWAHQLLKFAWRIDCDPSVLVLDDLDKIRATPAVQSELFNLVETTTANEIFLIVTTNTTSTQLAAKFADEFGSAIVARIREYCTPVNLDKP